MSDETQPSPEPAGEARDMPSQSAAPAAGAVDRPLPARRVHPFFWGLVGAGVIVSMLLTIGAGVMAVWMNSRQEPAKWRLGGRLVGIVPVEGEIFEARTAIDDLHDFAEDDGVKAIVVRINSPGGAIVPAQEIFAEIRKVRAESGKPVIASMDSVAASGGYYVAVACERIVANPGSITGSIGVIAEWFNLEDLIRWAKLKPETFTSGELKGAPSPFRQLKESERAYFQDLITQLHGQFVRAVADGRKGKLTMEQVTRLADGRVFTGEQAKKIGLIDELGTLEDAIDLAAELAGIEGTPRAIYPKRPERDLIERLLAGETNADSLESLIRRVINSRTTHFSYRW